MPQRPDVDLIRKAWTLKRDRDMTQQEMADELGLSPRTIANYLRPGWLAHRNLGHLRFAGQEPSAPRSTLENRAWEICESGDHGWMSEDIFKGHAYTESRSTEDIEGFGGSTLKAIYAEKTCHFCGLVMRRRLRGFVVT